MLWSMMKTLTEITLDHTSVITIKLIKIKLVIYPKFRLRKQLLINNNIKTLLDLGMVFKVCPCWAFFLDFQHYSWWVIGQGCIILSSPTL